MINQKNLHLLKNIIEISDEELTRYSKIFPTDFETWEYISHKYICLGTHNNTNSQQKFCDTYRLISDPSWPTIHAIKDFYDLPTAIQEECQTQHGLHPEIWFNKNISKDDWVSAGIDSYSLDDVIRAHYIINRNHALIQGQRVIDFPCFWGNLATWMSKIDFDHLALADVRQGTLSLAIENMQLLGIPNQKWSVIEADLHDLANNTKMCEQFDTLLCAGVLYHLHNHFDVLKSIAASGIQNIIIDTRESLCIKDSKEPLIWWKTEPSDLWSNGWCHGEKNILVGWPNSQWIEMAMELLGYRRSKPVDFYPQKNLTAINSVHVFCKQA